MKLEINLGTVSEWHNDVKRIEDRDDRLYIRYRDGEAIYAYKKDIETITIYDDGE